MNSEISKLIQLEHNCKNADDNAQLYNIIVNQTRNIVDYDQSVLLELDLSDKYKTIAISDIAIVDTTSPFVQFINELSIHLKNQLLKTDEVNIFTRYDLPTHLSDELNDYSPDNIIYIPLNIIKNGIEVDYCLILFRKQEFTKKEIELLNYIKNSYAYFLFSVRKCGFYNKLKNFNIKRKYLLYVFLVLILFMLLPVKMSILAPFEVKAKNPTVVTSPINGVVENIQVQPNQKVEKEDLLVKLDDIDFLNKYEIAKRELETVKAELYTIKQASFYDTEKKSQLKSLKTQVDLKEAQLKFAKNQLNRTKIYSNKAGVAILNNPKEWEGKPVSAGEKILLIANSLNTEIKIMVPVSDALFLKNSADVKVFLDNEVFKSWNAKVSSITYKPKLTPEKVLSYEVIAQFINVKDKENIPHIGLRGTAKLYSKEVTMFFYLFRKPITYMRQLIAW